ncbi:hypothetical protein ATY78_13090 [Rhizobium sp. R635]|uniref:hypothetical protein n=1 Tax=Rhizobium sp. R635 TaxID=1764275 RepID=UPI000B531FC9|nr:hypothetical protein [Rhizobium sp. R635]OWV78124.1 hypothetical protein ATY78_13090 [Rhizobium sp. R635]
MTISSTNSRSGPYPGNAVTTVFDYDFFIADERHLLVIKRRANGDEEILTLDADYSVSGVGNPEGGSIDTAASGAPSAQETITLLLNVPFTQETELENQGPFSAKTIETALDVAAQRDLQLSERLDRAIVVSPTSTPTEIAELINGVLRLASIIEPVTELASVAQSIPPAANVAVQIATVATVAAQVAAVAAIAAQTVAVASVAGDVGTVAANIRDVTNFADVYLGASAVNPVLRADGSALQVGDLYFNSADRGMRVYGGAGWVPTDGTVTAAKISDLQADRDAIAAKLVMPDFVRGLVPSPNAGVPLTNLDIGAGDARFGGRYISFAGTLTKRLNAAWSEGSGNGFLDTGAVAASKTYHVYVLRKLADISVGDFIASLSNNSAGVTVPVGWEILPNGRIGSVLTNASSQIVGFRQYGSRVKLNTNIQELVSSAAFDFPTYNPVGLPEGISTDARLFLQAQADANSAVNLRCDTEETPGAAGDASLYINIAAGSTRLQIGAKVRTTAVGLMWARFDISIGTGNCIVSTHGWDDYTVPRMPT